MTFSAISWLIVALPVLAFVNIAFLIIISGKEQRLARVATPWVLIVCLAAALVVSIGAFRETLTRVPSPAHATAAAHAGAPAAEAPAVEHAAPTWFEKQTDWLRPEPPAEVFGLVGSKLMDRTLRVGVLIDPLSATMMLVVLIVSLLVQIYSFAYMKREEHPRFYLFMSLFTASMLGLVISSNLLQLFIFWELVGLCSYFLIGFWYHKPEAARAAIKAFVVTRFGDLGLLFAVFFLWLGYGDLTFSTLRQAIAADPAPLTLPVSMTVVAILLFFGACGKSAQFPLHIWLPDAMEGPTSVSALIHAATMVAAGVFLVARCFFMFEAAPDALLLVALVGGFTALFAASIALVQNDMKKVMAYSTISQLGYMMMGLGLAAPAAAFFHLTTHAFFKALLFLTAGSVIHAVHSQNMWEMGGLFKKMKVTAVTCLIGGLALAGIFPLAGFFSKDKLLESALAVALGHGIAAQAIAPGVAWLILLMALATVLMTAFYTTRMWTMVFLGKPRSHGAEHAHEAEAPMRFSLLVLAGLSLVAGFLIFTPQWNALFPAHEEGLLPWQVWGMTGLSLALAIIGILWGYAVYGKAPAKEPLRALGPVYAGASHLWFVDAFFTWLAHKVVLGLAHMARRFDKNVIDGGLVDGSFWLTGRVGHLMRRMSAGPLPGQLQYYAFIIFVVAVLIMLIMSAHDMTSLVGVLGR